MKTTLNITCDHAMMATVAAALKNNELGRLFRALTARMAGEDAEQYLNNSGLRLAFALLSPSIAESQQRQARCRTNGARGGRPHKPAPPEKSDQSDYSEYSDPSDKNQEKNLKKSKKEDLPPTPPKEEKIKKNNNKILSPEARVRETVSDNRPQTQSSPVALPSLEELQEQMLREQPWFDELCMSRRIRAEDMAMYLMDFIKYLREQDARETLSHAKAHFVNQLPYIIKIYKTRQNTNDHENSQKFIADPVARRQFERESRRQEVCRTIAKLATQRQQPDIQLF